MKRESECIQGSCQHSRPVAIHAFHESYLLNRRSCLRFQVKACVAKRRRYLFISALSREVAITTSSPASLLVFHFAFEHNRSSEVDDVPFDEYVVRETLRRTSLTSLHSRCSLTIHYPTNAGSLVMGFTLLMSPLQDFDRTRSYGPE